MDFTNITLTQLITDNNLQKKLADLRNKGIRGGHNWDNFKEAIYKDPIFSELFGVTKGPIKIYEGVYYYEYRPFRIVNNLPDRTGFKRGDPHIKSCYDPDYFSREDIIEIGKLAVSDAIDNGTFVLKKKGEWFGKVNFKGIEYNITGHNDFKKITTYYFD